jgi:hypothetical protein
MIPTLETEMNGFARITEGWEDMLLPIIVVTLAMLIPIVAIITEHFQKKKKMELMEKAIEHGANLDNFTLDEPAAGRERDLPYRSGMVTLAVGVSLLVVARYVDLWTDEFDSMLVVGGAITGCIGLALLLNDFMNRDRFKKE